MSQLNYIYSFQGKSFNDQIKYPGERILYKNENIKFEDSKENKHYEANVFYTNFRVLCLTGNIVIDISYNFISGRSTKTPIFSGRKYIQIDFIIVQYIFEKIIPRSKFRQLIFLIRNMPKLNSVMNMLIWINHTNFSKLYKRERI